MASHAGGPSPALLAANRRLYQLREEKRLSGQGRGRPSTPVRAPLLRSPESGRPPFPELPEHLGWDSPAVTRALRAAITRQREQPSGPLPGEFNKQPQVTPKRETQTSASNPEIKLYPDLALGMLKRGQAAAGRLWLLLHHLDAQGRGWLEIGQAKASLTGKNSELRLCGPRQLGNLLRQGQGVFWQRDKERIWLKSAAKVAVALDVERLRGRPVALPLTILLSGIATVRAHFYASFHSGRPGPEKHDPGSPISRATLCQLTGVPERSQRHYERTASVRVRSNIAVGQACSADNFQERAWRHGRGTFKFYDHRAKLGPAGQVYVAWRLPNSYSGCHQQCVKGRQKKINQQIDLVNKWAQGNDLRQEFSLFHHDGSKAAKNYHRHSRNDIYWTDKSGGNKASKLWFVLPARGR